MVATGIWECTRVHTHVCTLVKGDYTSGVRTVAGREVVIIDDNNARREYNMLPLTSAWVHLGRSFREQLARSHNAAYNRVLDLLSINLVHDAELQRYFNVGTY